MTLYQDYNKYHKKYQEQYGEKTVVLYQCGSFYEVYGIDGHVDKIANLLNIVSTLKDKSKPVSPSNPKLTGFTCIALEKYLRILQENNYTTVLVEQITEPPHPKRDVTQIISPSTYIESVYEKQSNYIISIYNDECIEIKTKQKLNNIGISAIDCSTGKSIVYNIQDKITDQQICSDELYRFIHSLNPKEIILNGIDEDLKNQLNLRNFLVYENKWCDKYTKKISYQNTVLEKFYKNELLSPIEYLNLERYPNTVISFITLIQYVYEHDETLLKKLSKPVFWELDKYLILSNDTYEQLNLYKPNKYQTLSSVFDVINNTSTSQGERLLKEQLLNPITDETNLNYRYDQIEKYQNNFEKYQFLLKQLIDCERFHRKIILEKLHPNEFVKLYESYKIILDICKLDNNKNIEEYVNYMITEFEKTFEYDLISKCRLDKMDYMFFKQGIYKDLDSKYEEYETEMNKIITMKELMIDKLGEDKINLCKTDRDGYYFTITKTRYKKIKDYFKFKETIQSSNVKLTSPELKQISNNIFEIQSELSTLLTTRYKEYLNKFTQNNFKNIDDYISNLDCFVSNAKTATIYNYKRPCIDKQEHSYLNVKGLRHPLIERINTKERYVENDININKNINMIFGANCLGKTSLIRASAISIIMAQMGSFVPCSSMIYSPFTKILARISHHDNILKGSSSFLVELQEIKTILNRSDKNTFIVCDEPCCSTENYSALSIVSSLLIKLSKMEVCSLFTSHLHGLKNIPEVINLPNLKFYHLKLEIKDNKIYINRKLFDGVSNESIYGIEIADYVLKNKDFITDAYKIRRYLLNEHDDIIKKKSSKYNHEIFMDHCEYCNVKTNLHVHHKNFQCNANEYNMIDNFHKNVNHNLIVLCQSCHIKLHQEEST